MAVQNRRLGIACAIGVLFVWSGFLVVARLGIQTSLTAADIAVLRLTVAGGIILPFVGRWWPRDLGLGPTLILMTCGPGIIYSLLMFQGLIETSAAYGGVFANGTLPIFTSLIVALVTAVFPTRKQVVAIAVILAGGVLVGVTGLRIEGANVPLGIALLLAASAFLSIYIFGLRHWDIGPRQALVLVNVPNAVLFLPIWYFFMPSGMAEASTQTILIQALYQGLGPGFVAMTLFALAATNLGATATAGFSAAVPASAALLAIPVLREVPNPLEWCGIALVTLGLILLVRR